MKTLIAGGQLLGNLDSGKSWGKWTGGSIVERWDYIPANFHSDHTYGDSHWSWNSQWCFQSRKFEVVWSKYHTTLEKIEIIIIIIIINIITVIIIGICFQHISCNFLDAFFPLSTWLAETTTDILWMCLHTQTNWLREAKLAEREPEQELSRNFWL